MNKNMNNVTTVKSETFNISKANYTDIPLNREELALYGTKITEQIKSTTGELANLLAKAITESQNAYKESSGNLSLILNKNNTQITEMARTIATTNKTLATNQELLIAALTQLVKKIDNVEAAINNSATSQHSMLAAVGGELVKTMSETLSDKPTIKKELSSIFKSTITPNKCGLWKSYLKGKIDKLIIDGYNSGAIYNDIYSTIKKETNRTIDDLLAEYRTIYPDADKIDMVVSSDLLREYAEASINKYGNSNSGDGAKLAERMKAANKNIKPIQIESIPVAGNDCASCGTVDENFGTLRQIAERLLPYSRTNATKANGKIFSRAYRLAEKKYNIDLDAYVEDFRKTNNLPACRKSFVISLNKDLVNKIGIAVDEYIKEMEGVR